MNPEVPGAFPLVQALNVALPGAVRAAASAHGEWTLDVDPARIAAVCRFLRDSEQFVRLSDVTAVDWHPREPRFEVVYHVHSLARNQRLRLKCRLAGGAAEIETVTGVWRGADWYEREVFDLFGIVFRSHPNLDARGLGRTSAAQGLSGLRKQVRVQGRMRRGR
jgi:NADH-quinone oxidoreductase subunit C